MHPRQGVFRQIEKVAAAIVHIGTNQLLRSGGRPGASRPAIPPCGLSTKIRRPPGIAQQVQVAINKGVYKQAVAQYPLLVAPVAGGLLCHHIPVVRTLVFHPHQRFCHCILQKPGFAGQLPVGGGANLADVKGVRGGSGVVGRVRLIGLATSNCVFASYIVTDQNAFAGGNCPGAKVSV